MICASRPRLNAGTIWCLRKDQVFGNQIVGMTPDMLRQVAKLVKAQGAGGGETATGGRHRAERAKGWVGTAVGSR